MVRHIDNQDPGPTLRALVVSASSAGPVNMSFGERQSPSPELLDALVDQPLAPPTPPSSTFGDAGQK